ncbi:unnamed protein product [Paramecium pentaurelia]|uniref:Calcium-dependent protein kinase 1 n=1 Tax=Paramecium pentaurelia TaxID=43138 RepID=A0A8S1VTG4_9CILI|nr:unnamed protein product [Paramecium pentaurelia]
MRLPIHLINQTTDVDFNKQQVYIIIQMGSHCCKIDHFIRQGSFISYLQMNQIQTQMKYRTLPHNHSLKLLFLKRAQKRVRLNNLLGKENSISPCSLERSKTHKEIAIQQEVLNTEIEHRNNLEVLQVMQQMSKTIVVETTQQSRMNSLSQIGTQTRIKLGQDIFIHLKEGSINSHYRFDKVLGQGGFGKVWKVTHKITNLVRAIKQIKKSSILKEEKQRMFSEMNILKNLDHPNILKLFELYQDTNNYFLVTEYLSGGELLERIKIMTCFTENVAANYIRQILLATLYCHEKNIVHRDLKPENVIFVNQDPNSQLKVIDFGTSRKFDKNKSMSKDIGTPFYVAPEVLNHQYDEKCDLWSCGIILYVLLCGYPPFTGRTVHQVLERVKQGVFIFESRDWEDISKEAKSFISKLLRVDPKRRLSAREALDDPWLVKHNPTTQLNLRVLENIRQFQAQTLLRQALMSYMITQMSTQKEIQEIQNEFTKLDLNHDGILSKDEFMKGYSQLKSDTKLVEDEVERIIDLIDVNRSGMIDFSEFCMAAMNQEKLFSVQRIEQAFKIFDQNGDGFISKQDLEAIMGHLEDEVWEQILLECNADQEGQISYQEFITVLQQKTL